MTKFQIEDATVTLRLRNFTIEANDEDEARLKAAEAALDTGYLDKWEVSVK